MAKLRIAVPANTPKLKAEAMSDPANASSKENLSTTFGVPKENI